LPEEAAFVAEQIARLHPNRAIDSESDDAPSQNLIIGIIAASQNARSAVVDELQRRDISFGILRVDQADAWHTTMVCDIESCKGHEFQVVFVVGVQDGVFPRPGIAEDDLPHEAARLYVAMTRARRQLFLTHSTGPSAEPSPFLWLARSACNEFLYRSGKLESYPDDISYPASNRRKWENWLARLRAQVMQDPPPVLRPTTTVPEPQPLPITVEPPRPDGPPDKAIDPAGKDSGRALQKRLSKEAILEKLQLGELTVDEAEKLLDLVAPTRGQLYCKVSAKGAVSVYGLQRMPVTLYAGQWERLLDFQAEVRRFADENSAKLKRKASQSSVSGQELARS
jgi:hypothetical protein